MTRRLGWADAGIAAPPGTVAAQLEHEGLAELFCEAPVADPRDWLARVQACHRALPAFLPCRGGAAEPAPAQIRARLRALAGHGQLRLCLTRPARAAAPPGATGRAHLHALRARRRAEAAWRGEAEAWLETLAPRLGARATRLALGTTGLVMDLLLPAAAEAGLRGHIAEHLASGDGDTPGALAVSGLWVPLGFTDAGA